MSERKEGPPQRARFFLAVLGDRDFEGWHDPTTKWNGAYCVPGFERAVADEIVEAWNLHLLSEEFTGLHIVYDEPRDSYVEQGPNGELHVSFEREGRRLYALGAWMWRWIEIREESES